MGRSQIQITLTVPEAAEQVIFLRSVPRRPHCPRYRLTLELFASREVGDDPLRRRDLLVERLKLGSAPAGSGSMLCAFPATHWLRAEARASFTDALLGDSITRCDFFVSIRLSCLAYPSALLLPPSLPVCLLGLQRAVLLSKPCGLLSRLCELPLQRGHLIPFCRFFLPNGFLLFLQFVF